MRVRPVCACSNLSRRVSFYICPCPCVYTSMRLCVCVRVCLCQYPVLPTHLHTWLFVRKSILLLLLPLYVCTFICTFIYIICTRTHAHAQAHAHLRCLSFILSVGWSLLFSLPELLENLSHLLHESHDPPYLQLETEQWRRHPNVIYDHEN